MKAISHEGWFYEQASLVLPPAPKTPWRVQPGEGVVLVLFSSNRPRLGSFDRGVANDELVVQLDRASLSAGNVVSLSGLPARYQRGGNILTYESIDLAGTLRVDAYDDNQLAGEILVSAAAPRLDVSSVGSTSAEFAFSVNKKAIS